MSERGGVRIMTAQVIRLWQTLLSSSRISAVGLGALSGTAFPPLGLWPLAIVCVAAMIAVLRRAQSWKSAAVIGWLFGFAHLTVANNWIATAFTYQSEMPALLGWVAVPVLCIYLAIYPALAAVATHALARRGSLPVFVMAFAGAWILTEWLRSWVFTGYPWPPLGLALLGGFETPGLAVILPWIGTYALSGAVVLLAGAFLWLGERGNRVGVVALAALLTAAMHIPFTSDRDAVSEVKFALIQPLIPQSEREDVSKFEDQFIRTAQLTAPGNRESRLVLWPEAAIPDYLEDGYPLRYYRARTAGADPAFARERIGGLIGERSVLLAGLVHLNLAEDSGRPRAVSARNAVSAMNGEGELFAEYSKAHLVPYGEYLPMRSILEPLGLSRLVAGSIDYQPGPGPQTLELGRFGRAGVQVCYEIVFSGQVVDRANRPDFIFNPSNDGWFGTWGPPQHLAQARLRAIEEGLPVLRSTTTGISAVIDAHGVVRDHVPSNVSGRIDGFISQAGAPTLFAQLGNWLPVSWACLLLIASFVAMRRARV